MKLEKVYLRQIIEAVKICYAKEIQIELPSDETLLQAIFQNSDSLSLNQLLDISKDKSGYEKSLLNRIIVTILVKYAQDIGEELDVENIWELIYESIHIIPKESIISSIGSQGFLSIPIYKMQNGGDLNKFDFFRLHIWDNSLVPYFDKDICEKFSVHTHSFFAKSWIICGNVVNERFIVAKSEKPTENSLFTIGYNKTLNEINQHTSVANNAGQFVNVRQVSSEVYMQGGSYEIKAGHYHKSISTGRNGLSSTFFLFSGKTGLVKQSFVVGPSDIGVSEINRKMYIDPSELIIKINTQVKKND